MKKSCFDAIHDLFSGSFSKDIVPGVCSYLIGCFDNTRGDEDPITWLKKQWESSNMYLAWTPEITEVPPLASGDIERIETTLCDLLSDVESEARAPLVIAVVRESFKSIKEDDLAYRFVILLELSGYIDLSDDYYISERLSTVELDEEEHSEFEARVSNSLPFETHCLSDEIVLSLYKLGVTGTLLTNEGLRFEIRMNEGRPCEVTVGWSPIQKSFVVDTVPMVMFKRSHKRLDVHNRIEKHLEQVDHQLVPGVENHYRYSHVEGILHLYSVTDSPSDIYSAIISHVNELQHIGDDIISMICWYTEDL